MSPRHLLPASPRLVSSRRHQFSHELQQEPVSQILKEDRNGGDGVPQVQTPVPVQNCLYILAPDAAFTHLVICEVCSQCFCQHVAVWSRAHPHQQHRQTQSHEKHLRAKHLRLEPQTEQLSSYVPRLCFQRWRCAVLQKSTNYKKP